MSKTESAARVARCVAVVAVAVLAGGCASRHRDISKGNFTAQEPFSKRFDGSADAVCWSVKRALLSQGYMLDRASESGVLNGTKDFQPNPKTNVTLHMQTTCADNRDGTTMVFVTASREDSQLQRMKQSTSAGIGPATITMPSGSAKVLGVVGRETIQDPAFYSSFFSLVGNFAAQEQRHPDEERHVAELRSDTPDHSQ